MTQASRDLLSSLLKLPADERMELAEELFASVPGEDEEEAAFAAELERRAEAHLSGREPGVPGEEVFRRLREKYG